MRARLALDSSGQTVELREVVLRDKPVELLRASAKGTVPVLIDGEGRTLDESLDIMRWALVRHDPAQWLTPEESTCEEMLLLIAQCDGYFKHHLDRYKYPQRYPEADAPMHRDAGGQFLHGLNDRLSGRSHLFGNRPALADMAIVPFVRQFVQTDPGWFQTQDWVAVHAWLKGLTQSSEFARIMFKYPPWTLGAAPIYFPPNMTGR